MRESIPKWERELWFHVGNSNGLHCPTYRSCDIRQSGNWCAEDNKERIKRLVESRRFKLSDYHFMKPVECRIFQLVEMLAQQWLKRGRVDCPPVPTELVSLFDEHHLIEVQLLPLKTCHGAVWHLRKGWVIQLNDDETSASKRFTLFHEAFHILAHCKAAHMFKGQRGIKRGPFNEVLASYFAACVLMPREWVKEKWAEINDLSKMAKIFEVPKSAMCIKLKRLNLV